ncbi:hypothetical protein NL676_006391 [Syzygium grande]|nr:hypothetical protein NL676_006391 [Syzygium grande]
MYDAEEFIDKFYLREACERHKALYMATWPLAALVSKYKLWSDLSTLVNKMEALCDEKFLKEEAEGKSEKETCYFWDQQAPTNFLYREDKKKEIRERIEITGQHERWTSIWGEQGTGKTFLARWAYNQAKYIGYEWRAWVHVSAGMDRREFLLQILMQADNLAGGMKDMNIPEIRTKLLQKLAEINKYFIVLDDVQPFDKQLLEELWMSNPLHSQGHIITTTRDNSIAQYSKKQIKLEKLSEYESQKMLTWKLHRVPDGFSIPTRRLVRLWLAEGLLDSHCHDVERERTRQPEDVGETFILELADRNVIDVVSWRADGSPKACQMLTSLYDKICPIAMSTGFLHVHATSKSEDRKEGDPTSQQQQPAAQLRERTKIRWLAEHTNIVTDNLDSNYPDLNLGHVRSFLSFYQRRGMLTKDISTFLRKLTSKTGYSLLRVLDLEGVYKPYLQGVLHKLMLLRYLGLRSTVLDSIPSAVADLHHLETLDIKQTNITGLLNSLWKARKLRHLHLNWFYIDLENILKACSNNVNALAQLQTLSGLVIGEVKENLMRDLMSSLTTLTTLKLFLQHSAKDPSSGNAGETSLTFGVIQEPKPVKKAEKVAKPETEAKKAAKPAEEAQPAKDAERAEGAEPAIEAQPAKKDKTPKSQIGPLPKLSLALAWLAPGFDPVGFQGGSRRDAPAGVLLRSLRTLRLLANSFLCERMTFVEDGFPSLKILKIWNLPNLAEVTIKNGAMPHLILLELRHLERLTTVEGIEGRQHLEISPSDALRDLKGKTANLHVEKKRTRLPNLRTMTKTTGMGQY